MTTDTKQARVTEALDILVPAPQETDSCHAGIVPMVDCAHCQRRHAIRDAVLGTLPTESTRSGTVRTTSTSTPVVDRSDCQVLVCTCHDDSAWTPGVSYPYGCSACGCRWGLQPVPLPTEVVVDHAADAIVDAAMIWVNPGTRNEREAVRERLQDLVDGLVDACREHYREVYTRA